MIVCTALSKNYLNKPAVRDLNLTLEEGKIYALLGPNGSGKTTLMKMICGLVKPSGGTITFNGEKLSVKSREHIAYMPTEPFYYDYMTVEKVGEYYFDFYKDFSMENYNALLEKMKLDKKLKVKNLSSGMTAKLKVAATLSRQAQLIMLDEPLNGIDIIARSEIMSAIVDSFDENRTIVISSHLVDEFEQVIDNAVFMKDGQCVLSESAETIRTEKGKYIVDVYKEIYA